MQAAARVGTLLLVDDAENDRMLFKIAFDQAKPRHIRLLRPLTNGAEAIDYLSGAGKYQDRAAFPYPDVLALDLKMPYKTGFDVLEFLRAHPSPLIAVVLSDSAAECDKERASALGAADYFVKPDGLPGLIDIFPRLETLWSRAFASRILARPGVVSAASGAVLRS